jgi:hypothetical protein
VEFLNIMPSPKKKARNGKTVGAQSTSRQTSKFSARPTHELIPTMSVGKKKAPNHQQPPGTSKKIQLLDLPLEIRVLIYGHVLATKDKDGQTNVFEIEEYGDRKQLQQYVRRNNFQPKNFGWNHTALLAVNRQVREEVQTYCDLKMAFKFRSTMALKQFILDGEYYFYDFSPVKINMLHAATKIEVMVGGDEPSKCKNYRPVEPLTDIGCALSVPSSVPLAIEFTVKQSTDQATNKRGIRFFDEVVKGWKDWTKQIPWLHEQVVKTHLATQSS